jgi:methylmalonyl-CoA mutase cobalamin-binding domain/chain
METQAYTAKNKIRIVTAAALFDGHDAAINIMRRIMQRSGAEIIHLGHNRSAQEIVETAIQEDVQGIAITRLSSADVVRHPLVARIVDAYDGRKGAARAAKSVAEK